MSKINPTNIQEFVESEFETWFTMPLNGFPKEIQNLLRETAFVSFKAGAEKMLTQVNKEI